MRRSNLRPPTRYGRSTYRCARYASAAASSSGFQVCVRRQSEICQRWWGAGACLCGGRKGVIAWQHTTQWRRSCRRACPPPNTNTRLAELVEEEDAAALRLADGLRCVVAVAVVLSMLVGCCRPRAVAASAASGAQSLSRRPRHATRGVVCVCTHTSRAHTFMIHVVPSQRLKASTNMRYSRGTTNVSGKKPYLSASAV